MGGDIASGDNGPRNIHPRIVIVVTADIKVASRINQSSSGERGASLRVASTADRDIAERDHGRVIAVLVDRDIRRIAARFGYGDVAGGKDTGRDRLISGDR